MAWAQKRRAAYAGGVITVLAILIGVPAFLFLNETPTCSDGKRNGSERGVDCGGDCQFLCAFQVAEPNVLWSRAFKVVDGVYNAVAYVENPNFNAGTRTLTYQFRFYDSEGVLVAERSGEAYLAPRDTTPVFEPSITTGNRVPVRTTFTITNTPKFENLPYPERLLTIKNRTLEAPEESPKLTATIENESVQNIEDVTIVATIFNREGNAFATSRTALDQISGDASRELVFTWPEPFTEVPARIDIIPHIAPSE